MNMLLKFLLLCLVIGALLLVARIAEKANANPPVAATPRGFTPGDVQPARDHASRLQSRPPTDQQAPPPRNPQERNHQPSHPEGPQTGYDRPLAQAQPPPTQSGQGQSDRLPPAPPEGRDASRVEPEPPG